ncbi:cupin domain-containing protein [Bradyrhizobium barranii subsp. apii]|uniref:cupin domain-containing protein n=1 Tax=Bradyrhizobium barranii TaxID=2992140 RepID=UPI001AA110C0|nr:cupin domain-containing protein [Bradyrhizobium barranii]UPT97481.1 cupin domain-containing protein [Bradyrhizobium barranii subsp. apii]
MNTESFPALAGLIGPENVADFLSERLECAPYLASASTELAANNLLSIDDVDRFFSTIKYRTTECFCVNGDSPIDVSEFAYRGVVDSRKALRLFGEGATIVLNRVHLYHSPLSEICVRLGEEFSAPCQANVYLTPPNAKGFNLHYDTHDVFIFQSAGTKQWRVYGPALELPLAGQGTSERLDPKGDPILESELTPNQVLYIPRGWMHEGNATSSVSLHITFGMYFFTWADAILESVSHRLLSEKKYRSALPPDFLRPWSDTAAIERRLQALIADVASTVDAGSLKQSLNDQYKDQMQTNTAGLLTRLIRQRAPERLASVV